MRIYLVRHGKTSTLVRAKSQAAAIKHVTRDIAAEVATQDELVAMLTAGSKVEDSELPASVPVAADTVAAGAVVDGLDLPKGLVR